MKQESMQTAVATPVDGNKYPYFLTMIVFNWIGLWKMIENRPYAHEAFLNCRIQSVRLREQSVTIFAVN